MTAPAPAVLPNPKDVRDLIEGLIGKANKAKLEAHRMTKLGERRDVTLEVSRKVLELAL